MGFSHPTVGAKLPGSQQEGELTLTRVLGSGGFGVVYEATSQTNGSRVAVKFLHSAALSNNHEQQALLNEVTAAQQVNHEHVLRIVFADLNSADYPPYVVSEYADSGRLEDRLEGARTAKTPIPLDIVAAWSIDLTEAMEAVNQRVLHRDLKPDNILFSGETLKVADFGLAKIVGAATRSVTFKGGQHVLYMAPEAWGGEKNEIQIDMYAAGIVLFQIATLEFPLQVPSAAADIDAFRRMHVLQTPRTAKSIRSDLPQQFSEVLGKLMSKRPSDRYRSWADVRSAIERSFAGPAAVKRPLVVPDSILHQASERHRTAVAATHQAEQAAKENRERAEIDEIQKQQIVEKLQSLVDAFNAKTEGPKASLRAIRDRMELDFPYAARAVISFFAISPALTLHGRVVRFGALFEDGNGCGFNLLLQRSPDELYGEWTVCRVKDHAFSRSRRPCQYFGFGPADAKEIERGVGAMHVYVPEFPADLDQALADFVQSLYATKAR